MSIQSTLPAPRTRRRPIDDFDRQPTSGAALGDPGLATRRIAAAVLEVLVGRRPVQQLNGWVSNDILARLRVQVAGRRGPTPARAPTLGSVHVKQPLDGIAEATVLVWEDERWRALAMRLEGLDGRWLCTAFDDR